MKLKTMRAQDFTITSTSSDFGTTTSKFAQQDNVPTRVARNVISAFVMLFFCVLAGCTTNPPRLEANHTNIRDRSLLIVVTSADMLPSGRPTGLWLSEFAIPFTMLTQAGVKVTVASPKGGAVPLDPWTKPKASDQQKWPGALQALSATKRLDQVNAEGFDAIFIPGGHGPLMDMTNNLELNRLIESFDRAGKPIAAVCHGPAALLNARNAAGEPLIKGRKVTGFTNTEERLAFLSDDVPYLLENAMKERGAVFESAALPFASHVVRDGNLITGQNPRSAKAIGEAIGQALQSPSVTRK